MSDSERNIIGAMLYKCECPVIVDLGAYHGEDTDWMIKSCRNTPTSIMVEADPQNVDWISAANLPSKLIFGAIAERSGETDFWICSTAEGRGSGSIRRPTGHVLRNGVSYDFRKTTIPCWSLDDLYAQNNLDHIDILWVDIQAAERDMIAGGKNALAHTRYMFIEAEEGEEMYQGQAMRAELLALLHGWSEVQRFDFNTLLRNNDVT